MKVSIVIRVGREGLNRASGSWLLTSAFIGLKFLFKKFGLMNLAYSQIYIFYYFFRCGFPVIESHKNSINILISLFINKDIVRREVSTAMILIIHNSQERRNHWCVFSLNHRTHRKLLIIFRQFVFRSLASLYHRLALSYTQSRDV